MVHFTKNFGLCTLAALSISSIALAKITATNPPVDNVIIKEAILTKALGSKISEVGDELHIGPIVDHGSVMVSRDIKTKFTPQKLTLAIAAKPSLVNLSGTASYYRTLEWLSVPLAFFLPENSIELTVLAENDSAQGGAELALASDPKKTPIGSISGCMQTPTTGASSYFVELKSCWGAREGSGRIQVNYLCNGPYENACVLNFDHAAERWTLTR